MTFLNDDIKDEYYKLPPEDQLKVVAFDATCSEIGMCVHIKEVEWDPDSGDAPKIIMDVLKIIKDIV